MSEKRMGRIGQTGVYLGKCFRMFVNEKGWKSLISTVIIAVILAWVIGDNTFVVNEPTKTGTFAMICGCIWIGMFNSVQTICRERAIIKREHRTGLHITSYMLAHVIYEFLQCMAEGLILTIVFDIYRDFPNHGIMVEWIGMEFFISFTLIIFSADAIGLMISSIVKTENAAMTIMPFALIIELVLAGLMFQLPEDAEFLKSFTVSRWGLQAICTSADINEIPTWDTYEKMKEFALDPNSYSSWKDLGLTQQYDIDYDGTSQHLLLCWLMLILHTTSYLTIGTISLKLVDLDKR